MSNEYPIQGSDPRQNIDKPKAVWEEAYDADLGGDKPTRVLAVHTSEDPTSTVYFRGLPELYKGGATYRPELAPDFVGDPIELESEAGE